MLRTHRVCFMLIIIGSASFLGSEKIFAAAIVEDIELNPSGILEGQLVGDQTTPGMTLLLYRDGKPITKTTTDPDGTFRLWGLHSGNYRMQWVGPDGTYYSHVFRLWNHQQAPPTAKQQLLLPKASPTVIRGQYGNAAPGNGSTPNTGMRRIFRNPWITAAIISAAIAVPIAVTHGDNSAS